ncbi:right-handed parallel beta-helix repeat-containing protein [Pelagovum pacificum]|uniref:Right handed beta helix domain-containing protein n=1 Tax=Pelagovum pacificum TaxID=2588711 RepID=A0A5C5GFH2_9RHOB|nr:right-handed parallel beta-helix repeat-containing protein [Pelagovum pacificum]QQA44034.1 right-handed parallel beta-helix repeat-containing protein [Pelagovum pacificum]TNY32837.1 hypothetical protein FHY64_06050 [Pelagovum pacificum]
MAAGNTVTGTPGADSIDENFSPVGTTDNDDVVIASGGNDTINGQGGSDTVDYSGNTSGVFVNLENGTAFGGAETGFDSLVSIENVIGSAGDDVISGNADSNTMFLSGSSLGGGDQLSGDGSGAVGGIDTVDGSLLSQDLDIDLAAGTATGSGVNSTISGFENATGGSGNDTLTGSADGNTLSGGDGDDRLVGGDGADSLIGGEGTDTAVFEGGTFSSYTLTDTVDGVQVQGPDGVDLAAVELLEFSDATVLIVGDGGFATIQEAVDAASAGDTIFIRAGTYAGGVDVDKELSFVGQGAATVIDATGGAGFTLGAIGATATVSFDGLTINNASSSGIRSTASTVLGTLEVENSSINESGSNAIEVRENGISDVHVLNSTFNANGGGTSGGDGALIFFQYNGDALIQNVTITGDGVGEPFPAEGPATHSGSQTGIQFRGDTGSLGNVVMDNVEVNGSHSRQPVGFFNYDDIDGLSMNDVTISADSTGYDVALNIDGVGGDVDLTNTNPANGASFTNVSFPSLVVNGDQVALQGDATENTLTGGDEANLVRGFGGDDTLRGNGGDDIILGDTRDGTPDSDVDTALFSGNLTDYTISSSPTDIGFGSIPGLSVSGPDGDDFVGQVEILSFDGGDTVRIVGAGGYDTIQDAIDAANDGDTILVAGGVYDELINLNKSVAIQAMSGEYVTVAGVTVDETAVDGATDMASIGGLVLDPTLSAAGNYGILLNSDFGDSLQGSLVISGVSNATDIDGNGFARNGLYVNGGGSDLDVTVTSSTFTANGHSTSSGGGGDILLFEFTGDASFSGVAVEGTGSGTADRGIQVSGFVDDSDKNLEFSNNPIGTVIFDDVTVNGDYAKDGILFQGYNDFGGLSLTDVVIGAESASTFGWTATYFETETGNGSANPADGTVNIDVSGITVDPSVVAGNFGLNPNPGVFVGGYSAPDSVTGSDGADSFFDGHADSGDDTVAMGAGDDVVYAAAGNDSIDGGEGTDTAIYASDLSSYDLGVSTDADGRVTSFDTVTDTDPSLAGDEGTDTLTGVERVTFWGNDGLSENDLTLDLTQSVQLFNDSGDLVGTFDTIQDAVDAASDNFRIELDGSATYREQVVIDGLEGLVIDGNGATVEMVDNPATTNATTGNNREAVFTIENGEATLDDLVIDGRGLGSSNQFDGVYFGNASGTVTNSTVTGIRAPLQGDDTPAGTQLGRAIYANNTDGGSRTVEVSNNTIVDFQKNGIDLRGEGLTVNVTGNTIEGSGFLPASNAIAQNGIVLVFGATGTISGNTISEIGFARGDYAPVGILGFDAGDGVQVTGNTITGPVDGTGAAIPANFNAINFSAGEADDLVITGNTIEGALTGITLSDNVDNPTVSGNTFIDMVSEFLSNTGEGTLNGYNVELYGGANDASLSFTATDGADLVIGTDAADELNGGAGNDVISGGDGDDTVTGGEGDDVLDGGRGDDVLDLTAGGDDVADGGLGTADVAQLKYNGGAAYDAAAFDFSGFDATDGVNGDTIGIDDTGDGNTDRTVTLSGVELLEVTADGFSTFIVREGMSVQAAIDAAETGDTIVIGPGTFDELLTVNKTLNFVGANAGLAGDDEGRGPGSVLAGAVVTAYNVQFDGIAIDGSLSQSSTVGISGATVAGIGISNSTFENVSGDSVAFSASSTLTISNNAFEDAGIQLSGVVSSVVSGNSFNDAESKVDGTSTGTEFSGNSFSFDGDATDEAGLVIGGSLLAQGLSVTGNSYSGLAKGIVVVSADGSVSISETITSFTDIGPDLPTPSEGPAIAVEESLEELGIVDEAVLASTGNTATTWDLDASGQPEDGGFGYFGSLSGAIAASQDGTTVVASDGDFSGEGAITVDPEGLTVSAGAGATGISLTLGAASDIELDGASDIAVTGNADGNAITGNDGANNLDGGAGDDVLEGGAGDDVLTGGDDIDTVVLAGGISGYDISVTTLGNGFVDGFTSVEDIDVLADGDDGTDTLFGIERLVFQNGTAGTPGDDTVLSVADPVQLVSSAGVIIGTFATIQAAIDAATGGIGEKVLLADTVFSEDVLVDKELTILGALTGVAGTDGSRGTGESAIEGQVTVTADNVTLDGLFFDINASGASGGQGVVMLRGEGGTVSNSVFIEGSDDGTTPYAVMIEGEGNSVEGSLVDRSGASGAPSLGNPAIFASGADSLSITGNTLIAGIVGIVTGDGTAPGAGLTVTGNTITAAAVNSDSIFVTGPGFGPLPDGFDPIDATVDLSGNTYTTGKGVQLRGTGEADDFSGFGTSGQDQFSGYGGEDLFVYGPGGDSYDGGDDVDTVDATAETDDIVADLSAGTLEVGTDASTSLASIERFLSGAGDDTITGNSADNTIDAGAGNDVVIGASGDDDLRGGTGTDTISYANDTAGLQVVLNSFAIGAGIGADFLSGFENLEGGQGDDTLTGDSGDNVFFATLGSDSINGAGGSNTYDASGSTNRVIADLGFGTAGGSDVGVDSLTNIQNLVGGLADDQLTGDGNANTIDGGIGNDILSGGGGSDSIVGGSGNDRIVAGDGDDEIDGGAGSGDTLVMSGDRSDYLIDFVNGMIEDLKGTEGTDSFTGIEFLEFKDRTIEFSPAEPDGSFDFDGDLASDVFVIRANGSHELLSGQSGNSIDNLGVAPHTAVGAGNFGAGSDSPILVDANGTTYWDDGSSRNRIGGGNESVGVGDVNGDGLDEIIFANANTGGTYALSGDTSDTIRYNMPLSTLAAVGDFNGDGADDILLRAPNEGRFSFGDGPTGANEFIGRKNFDLLGVGDFDGNGVEEALMVNGKGVKFFIDGTNGAAQGKLDGAKFRDVAGVGDFNGDGADDVLLDDGGTFIFQDVAAGQTFELTTANELMAIGDYNGDGMDELLFQRNDGSFYTWLPSEDELGTELNLGAVDDVVADLFNTGLF